MYISNAINQYAVNRETRRKVDRYARKNKLSWIDNSYQNPPNFDDYSYDNGKHYDTSYGGYNPNKSPTSVDFVNGL